jgi:two-component system CheB/CheR fusion protein
VGTRVEPAAGGRALVVEIADTGAGIAPDVLPRIFEAFEQGRLDPTRQRGGLGLGLAISKAILDVHGGSLEAVSAGEGRGTTITVRMALHEPGGEPEAARTSRGAAGPGETRPLALLLVEDHADTAEVIAELLRDRGHRVRVAGSVAAALEAAAAEPFDLVISDLGLPDGSGLDLMRQLRDRHHLTGIAFSGYGTEEDRRQSAEAGFAAHLTKPVAFETLVEEIGRVSPADPGTQG